MTSSKAEFEETGAGHAKERERMLDYEALARMPLESLLYYVLVGDGRRLKPEERS